MNIPGYDIHEELGKGAMSVVFRATESSTGVEKAIKMLRPEHLNRKDLVTRFRREATFGTTIQHPNILGIEKFGTIDDNVPYMVLPLVDPTTLGEKIQQEGPLSVEKSVETVLAVLDAIYCLHRSNVVHRDIKAENILFSHSGKPLLCDLGLAFSTVQKRITSIGTGPLGTPHYMAPEQWMGESGNSSTDVYSCGVLLFYLLTGDFPFPSESPKTIAYILSRQPADLPSTILPQETRMILQRAIHKAIATQPDSRYSSAREMKNALESELGWKATPSNGMFEGITEKDDENDFTPHIPQLTGTASAPFESTFQPHLPHDASSSTDTGAYSLASQGTTNNSGAEVRSHTIETNDTPLFYGKSHETRRVFAYNDPSHGNAPAVIKKSGSIKLNALTDTKKANTTMQQLNDETNPQKLAINPVEIAPNSFWVGKRTPGDFFFANPYLRTFKGNNEEFNLIIDPGSSSDFAIVQAKCSRIIGNLSKINAAFINHQDPDVGSSVGPLIGRYSPGAYCLCTEDTWRLVHYYNIPRERFVPLEKYPNGFRLPTGHKLIPVPSPFCHFVGAMMIYDPETCVLYSGDLFGGLTDKNAKGLWADESDWVGMRAFHQIYMPTRGALVNAINNIRNIKGELKIIAPQHGRLLAGDIMHDFMERLEKLPCGLDILSDRQATPDELLAWSTVAQRVMKRASEFTTDDLYKTVLESKSLDGLIAESDKGIDIKKMGKYTIEQILRIVCEKINNKDIEGMIKYEAVFATGELGLPTPNMDIDEGDVPHNKGSMLGSLID